MKVYLIKLISGEIRTYTKGYKGPFAYFKNDYLKLIKYYENNIKLYQSKNSEKYLTNLKKSKIEVYMADETTPITKIDEYPNE